MKSYGAARGDKYGKEREIIKWEFLKIQANCLKTFFGRK
jgi:hypothetical protein